MSISDKIQESIEKNIAKKVMEKAFWDAVSRPRETSVDVKSEEELREQLENEGLDYWELREKDLEERIEIINAAGLDYADYEELFEDCGDEKTEDELREELEDMGFSYESLWRMDLGRRIEILAAVGLDYSDYEELFDNYCDDINEFYSDTDSYEGDSEELEDDDESINTETEKNFIKKHTKAVFISILIILLLFALLVTIHYIKKLIPIGYNTDELVGEHWEDVVERLEDGGFTQIKSEAIFDLEYNEIDEEGEVIEVSINGEINFVEKKKIPYDTRITVKYHTLRLLELPFSYKEAKKLNYLEVHNILKEVGFVNVKLEPIKDLILGWLTKDGEIEKITVNGLEKYTTEDEFRPDVEVVVHYHTFKDK